jgi:hypothetical protein
MPPPIQLAAAPDGTLTYLVAQGPAELPAVHSRDLLAAWSLAREAARREVWGEERAFRFVGADGRTTDIALHDEDALCWAGAVDRQTGLTTLYGMSLCLRLLALVDLLASARWTSQLVAIEPDGAALHPSLIRLAAAATLTQDARFDEAGFRARLTALPPLTPYQEISA